MRLKIALLEPDYYEVIIGKKYYTAWLKKYGYSRTFRGCTFPIKEDDIVCYNLYVNGGALYLDYNSLKDLVFVRRIDGDVSLVKITSALREEFLEFTGTK